jgi:modulator of FtsH protease HflC
VPRAAIIITVATIFALAILSQAMTFTVRFTESAVLTTFGKAGDGAIKTQAGLYFKWPDPIQSATKYDTRARFLQSKSETQQTANNSQLVVESFCTWRVEDPLKFFQRFSNAGDRAADHYTAAETTIRNNLRSAVGEVSRYRTDELFTPRAGESKLAELEGRILAVLQTAAESGQTLSDSGIRVLSVGINRIELPEQTTTAVFEAMKKDRDRLVKEIATRADADALTITSSAEANAKKIMQFAEAYAADIRQQGDLEAQEFIRQLDDAPEFAVFLKQVEFVRTAWAKRMTWIVDTSRFGFEMFSPEAQKKVSGNGGQR